MNTKKILDICITISEQNFNVHCLLSEHFKPLKHLSPLEGEAEGPGGGGVFF